MYLNTKSGAEWNGLTDGTEMIHDWWKSANHFVFPCRIYSISKNKIFLFFLESGKNFYRLIAIREQCEISESDVHTIKGKILFMFFLLDAIVIFLIQNIFG